MPFLSHSHKYDDIINLPHHVSQNHPPMDMMERAAQFSPFAALTGYEAAAKETGRLTQPRIELDESEKELLDLQIHKLEAVFPENPSATFTYFIPDARKEGGTYRTVSGKIRKIDPYRRIIHLESGEQIFMEEIINIL